MGTVPDQVMSQEDRAALETLDARLRTLLPEEYQSSYEDVQPVSMGSAGLKYGADGLVAWDEMWQTFCDLAMAGGPPHKGMLLEPATRADIDAQAARYDEVVEEICRGITLASELPARASPHRGWVRVGCYSSVMASWLLRAVVMENVAARAEGMALDLPAGPHFRLEKEIKNVITVAAKTCHYWLGHMPREQKHAIADLFAEMTHESPLLEAAVSEEPAGASAGVRELIAGAVKEQAGLRASRHDHPGWLGLECPSVRAAVWMMRALVTRNVLSRREGTALFVPLDRRNDPDGTVVVAAVSHAHHLAAVRGVL
jgi:sirohydrochlorin cobaltochelatase